MMRSAVGLKNRLCLNACSLRQSHDVNMKDRVCGK